jgi:hypothetical protein
MSMDGYMQKRAVRSGRTWKRRYFQLNDFTLTYFKSDDIKQEKPRGEFLITAQTQVKPSSVKEFGIELNFNNNELVLYLAAETMETHFAWMDAFNHTIEVAKRAPPPLDTSMGGQDPAKNDEKQGLIKRITQKLSRNPVGGKVYAHCSVILSASRRPPCTPDFSVPW